MEKQIYVQRQKKVGKLLAAAGFDALVICSRANVRYLNGFSGDDSWLVLFGRKARLITDSRYSEQAQKESSNCQITERPGAMSEALAKVLAKLGKDKIIGVEDTIQVRQFDALRKKLAGKVKKTSGIVEKIRQFKNANEVKLIVKAGKIADEVLSEILGRARVGMTESEIAGMIDFEFRKRNTVNSFETIVAFGSDGSMAHHIPGGKKLRKNDCILIDFGGVCNGYCCDITRCFAVGKVSKLYAQCYRAVFQAQTAAIAAVKDGAKIADVENAAKNILKKYKLPLYGHGTGHGLGLEVHEFPAVSSRISDTLKAGQVITIEPGVYLPGKFGIRIEDDCLITKTGAKLLTKRLQNPDVPILKI